MKQAKAKKAYAADSSNSRAASPYTQNTGCAWGLTIHGGPHFARGDVFSTNAQRMCRVARRSVRKAPSQPEAGEKKKRQGVIRRCTCCRNDRQQVFGQFGQGRL